MRNLKPNFSLKFLFTALIFPACQPGDNADSVLISPPSEQTIEYSGVPELNLALSSQETRELLMQGNLEGPEGLDLVAHYASISSITDIRGLSNALWAGQDASRNRPISSRLATEAYKVKPEVWSTLRSGIGYLNGLGVEQDSNKAIELLSSDILRDNAAAAYFLSLAYEGRNNTDAQIAALERAEILGHSRAADALNSLKSPE